ncbi:hypothetical protein [Tenacibaculum geojense]|uniref:Prenyltransferase n=1 Tax=Tenacibaculum geojense TaxID=915352 RepID=A0ABW3JMT4_9FLAO
MFKDLTKIIDWRNVLSIILILLLTKISFLEGFDFNTSITFHGLLMLIASSISLYISGSFIKFYHDKESYLSFFTSNNLKKGFLFFACIGIFLGSYVSLSINKPQFSFVFILVSLSTIWFAKNSKPKTIINNIFPSFVKSGNFMLIWWMDSPTSLTANQWEVFLKIELIVIYYITISFVSNFAKSVISDLCEYKIFKNKTDENLPIVLGEKTTKKVITNISFFIILVTTSLLVYLHDYIEVALIVLFTMLIPQIICLSKFKKSKTNEDYDKVVRILNFVFLVTVLAIPLMSFFLRNASK